MKIGVLSIHHCTRGENHSRPQDALAGHSWPSRAPGCWIVTRREWRFPLARMEPLLLFDVSPNIISGECCFFRSQALDNCESILFEERLVLLNLVLFEAHHVSFIIKEKLSVQTRISHSLSKRWDTSLLSNLVCFI